MGWLPLFTISPAWSAVAGEAFLPDSGPKTDDYTVNVLLHRHGNQPLVVDVVGAGQTLRSVVTENMRGWMRLDSPGRGSRAHPSRDFQAGPAARGSQVTGEVRQPRLTESPV